MSNKLDLPADLASLIEKREEEDRRAGEDRRQDEGASIPVAEDRRESGNRRQRDRRNED